MDGYKEGLEAFNFKRICEPFFIVHLTHQQQRSRLRETHTHTHTHMSFTPNRHVGQQRVPSTSGDPLP